MTNTNSIDRIRYGYWPAKQLGGEIPNPILKTDEYNGSKALNIACTQTGLSRTEQKLLVQSWLEFLPTVPASTIVFSSKVSTELFEAACSAPNIEELSVKWSSISSLQPILKAKKLKAFYLGSSPKIEDLSPLKNLENLRWLFIQNVKEPVDLSFLSNLTRLLEFGLSANRGKRLQVKDLEPLSKLEKLEMLWLVSINIDEGGLEPLHNLNQLKSLRSTFKKNSKNFKELVEALPSLKYFQSVG